MNQHHFGFPSMKKLLFLVPIVALTFCACDKPTPVPAGADGAANTNSPTPAAKPNPELSKLVGKWERPDGGYVLEIRTVEADGKVDAGYFNPSPINVSGARAYREGSVSKVFVELRDANYPGCTYSLTFDPQHDQLFGQYYQASMQQTFEVTFARLK